MVNSLLQKQWIIATNEGGSFFHLMYTIVTNFIKYQHHVWIAKDALHVVCSPNYFKVVYYQYQNTNKHGPITNM